MEHLTGRYKINDFNLDLRKQFIFLSPDVIRVLKQLAGWADRVSDVMAKEFYDHQFTFPPTLAFFELHARKKNITVEQLRQHLGKMPW